MIKTILKKASELLKEISPTPRLDAEVLLCHITGFSKSYLIAHEDRILAPEMEIKYLDLIKRRAAHEPIAYLTGHKEFYGYDFKVDSRVLVPRPETEHIVEESLKFLETQGKSFSLLDLGTGSGCICCTILLEARKKELEGNAVAVDVSSDALVVAKQNAEQLGVIDRITFLHGSWFDPVGTDSKFDIIVSNPPYIAQSDLNLGKEIAFEPHVALYSGLEGLDDIHYLLQMSRNFLTVGGALIFEFGVGQEKRIEKIATQLLWNISFKSDLSGRLRVALCS